MIQTERVRLPFTIRQNEINHATTYLLDGLVPISITPGLDVLRLALNLVRVEVSLFDHPVGELNHRVDLVVVRLHRREESLVLLDKVLGLLEVGWRLGLRQPKN